MSSANPTRIDEFKINVTFSCCSSQLLAVSFTICLFQSFKERLLLPFEAAEWSFDRYFFVLFPFFRFGSAKVRRFFYLKSFFEKNLGFVFVLLLKFSVFLSKRGAKVRSFYRLSQDFSEINSYCF